MIISTTTIEITRYIWSGFTQRGPIGFYFNGMLKYSPDLAIIFYYDDKSNLIAMYTNST